MSTLPDDAWRDAGLEDPDGTNLVEEVRDAPDADDERPEEYRPGTARPDLEGAAAEADVVEQSQVVPGLDEPADGADDEAGGDDAGGGDDGR
ncbi:hypothetical protein [Isoptericola sp. BMS4]|uniref:hypothetical protein n=1 Tax=Isoptericola sp. BMS4 TaxID=2527875 RepID=UPI00141EDBC7|nr:hypothetical protein [Isoptericola sp. BMS4]